MTRVSGRFLLRILYTSTTSLENLYPCAYSNIYIILYYTGFGGIGANVFRPDANYFCGHESDDSPSARKRAIILRGKKPFIQPVAKSSSPSVFFFPHSLLPFLLSERSRTDGRTADSDLISPGTVVGRRPARVPVGRVLICFFSSSVGRLPVRRIHAAP